MGNFFKPEKRQPISQSTLRKVTLKNFTCFSAFWFQFCPLILRLSNLNEWQLHGKRSKKLRFCCMLKLNYRQNYIVQFFNISQSTTFHLTFQNENYQFFFFACNSWQAEETTIYFNNYRYRFSNFQLSKTTTSIFCIKLRATEIIILRKRIHWEDYWLCPFRWKTLEVEKMQIVLLIFGKSRSLDSCISKTIGLIFFFQGNN